MTSAAGDDQQPLVLPSGVQRFLQEHPQCVVGGSYALRSFYEAQGQRVSWTPKDVDIFCGHDRNAWWRAFVFMRKEERDMLRRDFSQTANAQMEPGPTCVQEYGVNVYQVDRYAAEVKSAGRSTRMKFDLVHAFQRDDLDSSIEDWVARSATSPGCVSLRIAPSGERVFHLGSQCVRDVLTRQFSSSRGGSSTAQFKYTQRGYACAVQDGKNVASP